VNTRPIAMRDALLEQIYQRMQTDNRIFFLTADFGSPVLDKIRAEFPNRFANVGIAEQNLINVSAGLALEGFKVFAYAIAPFITMRCYEQIRVNLGLLSEVRKMNVNLIGVGAGYSYVVSGPTHQCYEDLTLMRAIPNMGIFSPADHITAASLLDECLSRDGAKYIRLDAQVLPSLYESQHPDIKLGFFCHKKGKDICLVATGYMLHTALKAAETLATTGLDVGVIDLFDITQFNEESLLNELAPYTAVVSLEEGFKGRGGLDAMLFSLLSSRLPATRLLNIGVEPIYKFELGTRAELHEEVGIGVNAVTKQISDFRHQIL